MIGGTAFTLTPLQYLVINQDQSGSYTCYTIFYPQDVSDSAGNNIWILGDYFLYRYYSIYDIVNNQIGFARSISYNYVDDIDSSVFPESTTTTNQPPTGGSNIYGLPTYLYVFVILLMIFFSNDRIE